MICIFNLLFLIFDIITMTIIEFNLIKIFLIAVAVVAIPTIVFLALNRHPKKEKKTVEEEVTIARYNKILNKAHKHARILLSNASVAAGTLISESKRTNENMEEDLDRVMQSIAQKNIHSIDTTSKNYEKNYEQKLEEIQHQIYENTKTMIQNTQNNYNQVLEQFTAELLKEAANSREQIDKKTKDQLALIDEDIEKYKKRKLEAVDQQVEKLIEKTYKDVLKRSIPEDLDRELIVKSLEDAKKEGMFKL